MRPGFRVLFAVMLFAWLATLGPPLPAADAASRSAPDPWAYEHEPSELLVRFRDPRFDAAPGGRGASPFVSAEFDRYLRAFGVNAAGGNVGDGRTYRLRFRNAEDLRARREALRRDPNVEFAEPNYLLTTYLKPNDANYREQWAPERILAERAWDITTGGPITIAMLDTGVSRTHPDLAGRLVDGFDFVNNDADPSDDNGHGTFTAGIAGASGNNGLGVAGISWGAKLMPVKILDQDGRGPVSAFAQGIRFAVDNNAQIVNVSAGIPVPSQTMEAAVSYAIGRGVSVVAASGNQPDGVQNYPAAYPSVIAVSASNRSDRVADFSSYGSHIWLAAPGEEIVSTFYRDGDNYAALSGTSASAPFVSGTIALMLSQRGGLTPRAIREILRATAVDLPPDGLDAKAGYGRLDSYHAVILAGDPQPTLPEGQISPTSGKSTDSFIFTAGGFEPNEPVTVWLTGSDGAYRYYRYPQVYANASGVVQVALSSSEPLPAGDRQKVTAYGEAINPANPRARRVATATFSVTQPLNTQAFTRVGPGAGSDTRVYFPESGHTLGGPFLRYWQERGGLPIFGFPISEEFTEVSPTDGKPYTVQYFERNRFEYHPENAGTEFEVLLGLLGRDLTAGRTFAPAPPPLESTATRAYFPETRHSLSGEFLVYWQQNGGLAIFGYPISEPFTEISPTDGKPYLVQYFERNRFELHPENEAPYNVLLGLLGNDIARKRQYVAP